MTADLLRECRAILENYAKEYAIGDEASELQYWPKDEVARCRAAYDLLPRIDAYLASPPERWIPVGERLPEEDERVFYWLVPKPADQCPVDGSGKPIVGDFKPYRHEGKWGTWSGLSWPTHWMPLPSSPSALSVAPPINGLQIESVSFDEHSESAKHCTIHAGSAADPKHCMWCGTDMLPKEIYRIEAPIVAPSEVRVPEGELWSLMRRVLEQGAAIQQDYAAGKFPTYEHYAARIDEAARERSDALLAARGQK